MNHKIIRTALALFFVSVIITAPRAQQTTATATKQSPEDRIALYQALLDLTNPWTVMCIAAHPDDEDGTSLVVMRRKYGAHTVSLFSTFGEGGQNAIGPELYEEMGAIRARETMAAAEIQGSEPYFLGLKDFGFSKSADEAFRVWGHDEALRRMVLQIRKLRPDVIITNHNTTNGHGHHQATGRLELEAFDAAADPKRFPEQLKNGVTTWQVLRLFLRVGFGNQLPEQNGGTVTIDPNERDPIRDTVFAEEALRALQKHATQGPWPKTFADMLRFRNSQDGKLPLTRYVLVREAKGAAALPKESHYFLEGLQLPVQIAKLLSAPVLDGKGMTEFVDQRGRVLDALIAASKQHVFGEKISGGAKDVLADLRRPRMLVRLNRALATAAGISAQLTAATDVLIPGDSASFELALTNNGENPVRVGLTASGAGNQKDYVTLSVKHHVNSTLPAGETIKIPTTYKMPENALLTVPHSEHLYDKGFAGTAVVAAAFVELQGIRFPVIAQKLSDVAPAVEIEHIGPTPLVTTPQTKTVTNLLGLSFINHKPVAVGRSLQTIAKFDSAGSFRTISEWPFTLEANTHTLTNPLPLEIAKLTNQTNGNGFTAVTPRVTLLFRVAGLKPAPEVAVPIVYADARVANNLYVGYVRGFDYSLLHALDALGVPSKELTIDEVRSGSLQKYSSIIVDNRVYESQPELIAANQKLLDYANAGGTLIVFYHKSNEWNPDPKRNRPQQLAPYKLILGDERVTDETAPITFIEPEHPLLNFPNKMGQEDFANWIQERGLYYPKDWDPQYHALLQSNDPGEAPLKGGLLAADYGRGHYIYTSMVWYRELRAGIPGAYRMLANMISYGQAEGKREK